MDPSGGKGHVVFFEGPDGVGKTTLHTRTCDALRIDADDRLISMSFPGSMSGSLGELVYRLHHDPNAFGISEPHPLALQTLHVAAHIDALERLIRPAVEAGQVVLLDRFWWSTWVYGIVAGVSRDAMDTLVSFERSVWGKVRPTFGILVTRSEPIGASSNATHRALSDAYDKVAQQADCPVYTIRNEGTIEAGVEAVAELIKN